MTKRSSSVTKSKDAKRVKSSKQDDKPAKTSKRGVKSEKSPIRDVIPAKSAKRAERFANESITTRAGGAYIPPAKLKLLQQQISDKSSEEFQRLEWERLKKRINGCVNKVNVSNVAKVVQELLKENVIRGKGLFARAVIQAQGASPTFSHVYAALVAIINSKFPKIGELVVRRVCLTFKRAFARNNKAVALTSIKFVAHLTNQQVVHELLALEILTLLLETPTEDSIELGVAFTKEVGVKLTETASRGVTAIFDSFRSLLNDQKLTKRVEYMVEVLFQIRKDKFKDHPSVIQELDLVEEEDQITHTISLDDATDPENKLNVFQLDNDFEKNEAMYAEIRSEILGDDEASEEGSGDEEEEAEGVEKPKDETQDKTVIIDKTEEKLIAFRRTVYLVFQSSLDFQEAVHKLCKMQIPQGMENELCHMIVDCCAQNRTYEKFYGLLAERFCRLKQEYRLMFEQLFRDSYDTVHRLESTKLRNVARLFAHLYFTDAMSWEPMAHIKLNENDTTSAGRIFIKILFQELSEYLGLEKLFERINDPTMQSAFDGLFPRDDPHNTRFAINYFTSIGLGGLTVDLRKHLQKPER